MNTETWSSRLVRSPVGIRPENDSAGEAQQQLSATYLSSSARAPTSTNLQLSNSNKNVVIYSIWFHDIETDGRAVIHNITLTLTWVDLKLSAWGYNWATLFMDKLSMGTWCRTLKDSHIGTVKYGHGSCRTQTPERLCCHGSAAASENYRPILPSERAPHIIIPAPVWQ